MNLPVFPIDLASVEQDDLRKLAHWVTSNVSQFPRACDVVGDLVATEAIRREDQDERQIGAFSLPAEWSDDDVACCLEGITAVSFAEGLGERAGKLLDTLTIAVVAEAARRLRQHATRSRTAGNN